MFAVNFHKNASKQHKSIVKLYVAHIEEKNSFFLIVVTFYCFDKKDSCLNNPNFLPDLPIFKLVEKNKLFEFFRASFLYSRFFN